MSHSQQRKKQYISGSIECLINKLTLFHVCVMCDSHSYNVPNKRVEPNYVVAMVTHELSESSLSLTLS